MPGPVAEESSAPLYSKERLTISRLCGVRPFLVSSRFLMVYLFHRALTSLPPQLFGNGQLQKMPVACVCGSRIPTPYGDSSFSGLGGKSAVSHTGKLPERFEKVNLPVSELRST